MSSSRTAVLLALVAPLLAAAGSTLQPVAGSTYTISPMSFPDLCLAPSADSNGGTVVTKDCNTADDIVWTYSGTSFVNAATNKCMDIKDGGAWSGNHVQIWDCFGNNRNQVFGISNENVKWAGQDFCFDLTDGSGVVGNHVQIWTCYGHNTNQMWEFVDAEEVDSCDGTTTNTLTTSTATASTGASSTASAGASSTAASADASSTASAGNTAALGGNLLAPGQASATRSVNPPKASSTGTPSTSGYLQTSGTQIVDANGKNVILKGTNLGGWLVSEDWMNGISDYSGNGDRFAQVTLENRFGVDATHTLFNAWYDNFLTTSDWDNLANLGFNVVRLPFGFRNLQWANGSWITDASGNIDFSRLDWAIAQAKQRNIYVIPVFHIWDTQQQKYSLISEDCDACQASRNAAKEIWVKVAGHFLGESTIAAYDAINEPTGSFADTLQRDLYDAIRSVDPKRIIVMESISTNPANYGWTNVVYSWHEYNMMGSDYGSNMNTWNSGYVQAYNLWSSYNIPTYMGEYMADGPTLDSMISSLNQQGVWWTPWTYKTVNMGRWGLYNLPGFNVDVSNDSYESILNQWSNLGSLTRQAVTDQYTSQMWKRNMIMRGSDAAAASTAQAQVTRRSSRKHGGRSKNIAAAVLHGKRSSTL